MLCVHSSKWMDEFSMSTSTSTSNGSHGIVGISNMDISASTATAATVYEWTISTSSLAMNTHLSHAWMCEKLCIPRICIMQTRPKMKVVRGFLLSLSLSPSRCCCYYFSAVLLDGVFVIGRRDIRITIVCCLYICIFWYGTYMCCYSKCWHSVRCSSKPLLFICLSMWRVHTSFTAHFHSGQ